MLKKFTFLFFIAAFLFSTEVFPQKAKPTKKPTTKPVAAKPETEKEAYEKALAQTDLEVKIKSLKDFAQKYPNSANKTRALELAVSTQAQAADQKLRDGKKDEALNLFKQAVADAPVPISEELFTKVILQFPTNLFYGGDPAGAGEIARSIEMKVADKPKQLLGLATFYLGTENAAEAQRIAEKAIALDGNLSAAYQTLGLANRLNFRLEEAAAAYAKALEIDPDSIVSRRSLAEMKRALGKSDEAITLYNQILEKDANDGAARNGLILALFNAGKKAEAEEKLTKALEENPNNFPLLVGAAYWYAANNQGERAVELAQKAIAVEPRYTWAHIAMARGLAAQNRPLDAEKSLLLAKQYGNFPTLDYEIASVRMAAGFFQEAANDLKRNFTIKDGVIETKLANRIPKQSADFIELLELERRASIFEPQAADSLQNAEKLKSLLALTQTISSTETTAAELDQAIEDFTKGDDKMKTHRQIYVASKLLQEKKNIAKAYQLTQASIRGVDDSLTVKNAASAVLADELFESRALALSRGEVIVVPEVPRQTLSAVLRGRIEDIAGWSLYQEGKTAEAIIRLKRAVSILPEKSSFWRASMWRLGSALDAEGNAKKALEAYIKSYTSGEPSIVRRAVIEAAYQKVNGNLNGLDDKIGARPEGSVAQIPVIPDEKTVAANSVSPNAEKSVNKPEIATEPKAAPTPTPEISPIPTPTETPVEEKPQVSATPPVEQPTPQPTPAATSPIEEKPAQNQPENKSAEVLPKTVETPTAPEEKKTELTSVLPKKAAETEPDESRPRVIISDNLTGTTTVEMASCLVASQNSVSIINNGGSLGILVGYTGEGDIAQIKAESPNTEDVEITRDPEIGKMSNRVFFVIKSISAKTGEFPVVITAPCGKKEIRVTVR